MAADSHIMEALARIEHKLDLVLEIAAKLGRVTELPKVGDSTIPCVLCSRPVEYQANVNDAVVVRKCGCSTGKIALDMRAFAPPVTPARKTDDGTGTDQEDRRDSTSGRGNRSR